MKNFIQNGDYIDVVAPEAGYESGQLVIIGGLIGVAVNDAAEDESTPIAMKGVFELPKGSDVFAVGDLVYYDEGDEECVDDDEETLIGICVKDAATGAGTVMVRLMVGAQGAEGPAGQDLT